MKRMPGHVARRISEEVLVKLAISRGLLVIGSYSDIQSALNSRRKVEMYDSIQDYHAIRSNALTRAMESVGAFPLTSRGPIVMEITNDQLFALVESRFGPHVAETCRCALTVKLAAEHGESLE
jgi:hypothetical protein